MPGEILGHMLGCVPGVVPGEILGPMLDCVVYRV